MTEPSSVSRLMGYNNVAETKMLYCTKLPQKLSWNFFYLWLLVRYKLFPVFYWPVSLYLFTTVVYWACGCLLHDAPFIFSRKQIWTAGWSVKHKHSVSVKHSWRMYRLKLDIILLNYLLTLIGKVAVVMEASCMSLDPSSMSLQVDDTFTYIYSILWALMRHHTIVCSWKPQSVWCEHRPREKTFLHRTDVSVSGCFSAC